MKNWIKGTVDATGRLFEILVNVGWWWFAIGLWISIFTLPFAIVFLILAYTGILKNVHTETTPLNLGNIATIIILSSLSCFYIVKLRKQTVSTMFKFLFLCVFYYAGSSIEGSRYRYYVEHYQAGIVKVHIVDAETKEPLKTHNHKPLSASSSSKDPFTSRYTYSVIPPNLDMEYLVWGIEPITFEIGSEGYESKTILLNPQKRYDDITLEMQKIKPAK